MYPLLFVHICAGVVAFPSGVAALYLRKGSRAHRISGSVFFVSMLVMSGAGAYMAEFINPLAVNAIAGTLTFYMVATGWLAARHRDGQVGAADYGFLLMVSLVAVYSFVSGEIVFGGIALLCIAGDVRMLISPGRRVARRIARHLWRMCFGLCITTVSLFVGNPNKLLLPAVIRESGVRFVPVLIVLATSLFWILRANYIDRSLRRGSSGSGSRTDPGTLGMRVVAASSSLSQARTLRGSGSR